MGGRIKKNGFENLIRNFGNPRCGWSSVCYMLNVVGCTYGLELFSGVLDSTVWDSTQRVGVDPYIGRFSLCSS